MNALRSALLLTSTLVLVACGGSKQPAATASVAEPAPALPSQPEPLTPVEQPAGVFALARITDIGRAADALASLVALPMDWRTLLAKQAPDLSSAVPLGAPIDVAVMIDPVASLKPNFLWAVSVGASSTDAGVELLRARGGVVTSSAGELQVVELESAGAWCVVGPALGAAPARLVCSRRQDALDALQPYMTRTMPTEALGTSDLQLRLRAAPLGSLWALSSPAAYRAGASRGEGAGRRSSRLRRGAQRGDLRIGRRDRGAGG